MIIVDYHNNPIHVDKIAKLYELAFKRPFNKQSWLWRFTDNPNFSKIYISYVIDNNELISYYAVSPLIFNVFNKNEKIALSMMTMTHPDYTGKGLFTSLAKRVYNNLQIDGFYGVYGFANTNSHYGFRKNLGWKDINQMITLSYRNNQRNYSSYNHITLDKYFLQNLTTNKLICNNNSLDYLSWRTIENPTHDYFQYEGKYGLKLIYKIFGGNEIDIVYYKPYTQNLIDDMKNFLILMNDVSQINIWVNLHHQEHLIFEKLKFVPSQFNSYFGFIPFYKNDSALNYKNWKISMLDSDIF